MGKKIIFAMTLVLILVFSSVVLAGEVDIAINDEEVWLGVPPLVQDQRTIVPVRPLLEALKAKVFWDDETQKVHGIKGDKEVYFITKEEFPEEWGKLEEKSTDPAKVPSIRIQSRTFAPLRPTVEALGCYVEWDELTQTIAISSMQSELPADLNYGVEFLSFNEAEKIDVNSASFWELLLIPEVDEAVAKEIIQYREENGKFTSFDGLEAVPGVDNDIQETIKENSKLVYYERGNATSYGGIFHGRRTASGEIYDKNASTAAHPTLPFGTMVKATFLETGKSTWVRINDRGPCQVRHPDRIIDLSRGSAYEIGLTRAIGVGEVELKIVKE